MAFTPKIAAARATLLRADELARRLRVSRTTIWRWERDGLLPRKTRLGPNIVGWRVEEIDAWIASKVRPAGRPPEPAGEPEKQDAVRAYPPGTRVKIGGDAEIPAVILAVKITAPLSVEYLVAWWDGRSRREVWLADFEVSNGVEKQMEVGF